jgi:ubiquinone/menaquinone biosynthesis C-methylase UbiE
MNLMQFIARQARQPSGKFSGIFAIYMNLGNNYLNKLAVQALDIQPNDHILEVGFGGGVALYKILKNIHGGFVAGIDYSPDMVKRGKSKFQKPIASGTMTLVEGNVASMPFNDTSFDKVCTVNTIYFWPDPTVGLEEILRVLKPGGQLVIGVGAKDSMEKHRVMRYGFTLYSEQEIRDLLTQAGFVYRQTIFRKFGRRPAVLVVVAMRP